MPHHLPYQVENSKVPPPYYAAGEVKIPNLSQHAKMTPIPSRSDGVRPNPPRWMPTTKPPEPWREAEKTEDFNGLAQPYRDREDVGDGGRLGGEFVYERVEGVEPGEPAKASVGECVIC